MAAVSAKYGSIDMPRPRRPSTLSPKGVIGRIQGYAEEGQRRWLKLGPRSKAMIATAAIFNVIIIVAVIIITPHRIGEWFNALAVRLRSLGAGGMIMEGLLVVLASHPPLFGFAGSMTLIGFTYGIWPGFLIATVASLTGAAFAFLSIRMFFLSWIRTKSNPKWDAFGAVVKAKGLLMVCLIRFTPMPWNIGNGLFASIEHVKFWQYMLANLLIQPRLLIPVFIGSRLTSLTSEEGTHDPVRFWVNLLSIGLSLTVSTVGGIWIYRLTLEQMRKLDLERGSGDGELAAEALEEGALLGDYDEREEEDEPLTVRTELTGLSTSEGRIRLRSPSDEE